LDWIGLSTVDSTRGYARVSHPDHRRQWSNYNFQYITAETGRLIKSLMRQ